MFKRIKKKIKRQIRKFDRFFTLKILFPLVYKWYARKPVDESKVIFVEVRLKGISNCYTMLYNKLSRYKKLDIKCHNLRLSFVRRYIYNKNCLRLLRDMATAKYVFMNEASNAVSSVKKRKETIVFQTWHGCGAFKKFGFSTAELIFGENEKNMLKYPFYNNMDYVSVSSPEVIWAYEQAFNSKRFGSKIIPIGISRSDIYFDEEYKKEAFKHLYDTIPQARGKKIIIYAPTFRGRVANAQPPHKLNLELLNFALSDEYVILIKHHPLVRKRPPIPVICREFAMDVSDIMSIEDLMIVSDVCISDYSSLVFEYSLLEKPIMFLCFDIDSYIDWRGFYYPYDQLVPGPMVNNTTEIIHYIKNIDKIDIKRIHEFRERFMSSCDGHATDRIIEFVFGDKLKNQ